MEEKRKKRRNRLDNNNKNMSGKHVLSPVVVYRTKDTASLESLKECELNWNRRT